MAEGEVRIYCEACREQRPLEPIVAATDALNPGPWAGIIRVRCHYVIATITVPEAGTYGIVRTGG